VGWERHVARMVKRNSYKISVEKEDREGPFWRPWLQREGNTQGNLKLDVTVYELVSSVSGSGPVASFCVSDVPLDFLSDVLPNIHIGFFFLAS
jgi:hypothetical protein